MDDGWLGDIYYAEATYLRRRGVPTWGVFTDKSKQGGGPLIDIGTHALDLTLFLMNNYDVDYVVGTSFEKLGQLLDPKYQGQVNHRGEQDNWNNKTYDVGRFRCRSDQDEERRCHQPARCLGHQHGRERRC